MNRILLAAALIVSVVLAVAAVTGSAARAEAEKDGVKANICKGLYALCTSAPCIPDPENRESKALCSCEVNKGINYGHTSCDERTPSKDDYGITTLISTYSFAQGPSKPILICPEGKPWTDCLDRPCTIDPMNPLRAMCKCEITRDTAFVTYGGDCNTLTCDSGFWSGATIGSYIEASNQLSKYMGMRDFPVTYCPGMKPK